MSYFADLTPYRYLYEDENVFNVGWLDAAHPYPRGPTPTEFVEKLAWLCLNETVNQTLGIHACDMCEPTESEETGFVKGNVNHHESALRQALHVYISRLQSVVLYGKKHVLGSAEIRVSGSQGTYAAPDLILHYVVEHRYRPPEDFVQGVLHLDDRLTRKDWSLVRGAYWDPV